jgi:hypothetical protein
LPGGLLAARGRRAPGAGIPAIRNDVVLGDVFLQGCEIAPAVAIDVLELPADVTERPVLPGHRQRRYSPARIARNASVIGSLVQRHVALGVAA